MRSEDILDIFRRAGVRVVESDIPTAAVRLTPDGYELMLGQLYRESSEEHKVVILWHEMAHILRGDCLLTWADQRALNIAADMQINESWPDVVRSMGGYVYRDWYERLGLPEWLPDLGRIYRALRQQTGPSEPGGGGKGGEHGEREGGGAGEAGAGESPGLEPWDEISSSGDRDGCVVAHHRTVSNISEDPDLSDEAREIIKSLTPGGAGLPGHEGVTPEWVTPERVAVPVEDIRRVITLLTRMASGRERIWQRTWRRERHETVRGGMYLPGPMVLVALDCSGSVVSVSQWVYSIAYAIRSRFAATEFVAFDTKVHKIPRPQVFEGGGTLFVPVFEHASRRGADVLVMITDGDAADMWGRHLPPCPVLWVLVAGHRDIPLRAQDRIFVKEGQT